MRVQLALSRLKFLIKNQQMAMESETMEALIDSAEAAAERKAGPPLFLYQSSKRKQAQKIQHSLLQLPARDVNADEIRSILANLEVPVDNDWVSPSMANGDGEDEAKEEDEFNEELDEFDEDEAVRDSDLDLEGVKDPTDPDHHGLRGDEWNSKFTLGWVPYDPKLE